MKFSSLMKMPKLIKHKLEFGTLGDLIAIVRQSEVNNPICLEDDEESLVTIQNIQSALLKRIALEVVRRKACIDHRELDEMIDLSKDFGFEVVELKLGQGDYQSDKHHTRTINIERKEKDFIPSLFANRHIYEQLKAMSDNEEVKASYLMVSKTFEEIKWEMEHRENPIPRQVLITYVGELCLMGYPPLFINDRKDFIDVVTYMFTSYYDDPERIKRVNRAIKVETKEIIKFPGISDKLGERLLEHFGSIKAIVNANSKDLQKVKGVGKKTADEIYDLVN